MEQKRILIIDIQKTIMKVKIKNNSRKNVSNLYDIR